ncbi:MAG: OmpA family protein [Bryobacteraceae bacterium]
MTATIVNDLSGLFQSQALGEASAQLGESESSVMRGFEAASSAIVGALTTHLGQSGFMKQAYELITSPLNDGRMLSNIRGFFAKGATAVTGDGLSRRMLSMLFGGNQATVAQGISETSGLRPSSAWALMAAAAPMVLGLLGRRVKENHLDPSGLSTMLLNEESAAHAMTGVAGSGERRPAERTNRWLLPLALAVLGIFGLFWMLNHGRGVANQAANVARSNAASLGDLVHRTLPNGIALNIPQFGMETKLLDSIQSASLPIDHAWFRFDRLSFDSSSAKLRPESTEQLANIAHILKAYPALNVTIGGFTDNTGDAAANLQLSQARANSVMQELVKMGVAAGRLEAEGFGGTAPVADNSTESGRLRNRRVALRITAQ